MSSAELRALLKSAPCAHHAGFVALLTALSLLSLSALGLANSLYRLYYEIASPEGGGLVVSSYSVSPITSVVRKEHVEELVGDAAGARVEFVVLAPVLLGGRVVVVRGLEGGKLRELLGLELPSGYCLVVGRGLAEDLGIREGDVVPLHSVLTGRAYLAYVCGVADLPRPYGFEVISGVELARELRGVPEGSYSIAVIRSEDPGVLSSIASRLGLAPEEESALRRALLLLTQRGGRLALEVVREPPEAYLSRLGLHRDVLYYLAYSVAAAVMLCLPLVGEAIVRAARGPAGTLRLLGVSRARLLLAFGSISLAYAAPALSLSTLASGLLGSVALRALSYPLTPSLGAGDVAAVGALQVVLLLLGVAWGVAEHVE